MHTALVHVSVSCGLVGMAPCMPMAPTAARTSTSSRTACGKRMESLVEGMSGGWLVAGHACHRLCVHSTSLCKSLSRVCEGVGTNDACLLQSSGVQRGAQGLSIFQHHSVGLKGEDEGRSQGVHMASLVPPPRTKCLDICLSYALKMHKHIAFEVSTKRPRNVRSKVPPSR